MYHSREIPICIINFATSFIPYIFIIYYFGNIFKSTVQNTTEFIERKSADVLVFSESVKLPAADVMLVYKFILRDAPLFHCFPQSVVFDHFVTASLIII